MKQLDKRLLATFSACCVVSCALVSPLDLRAAGTPVVHNASFLAELPTVMRAVLDRNFVAASGQRIRRKAKQAYRVIYRS